MLGIFTKPIESICLADISELITERWPEGYQVEFKSSLPVSKGGQHPWVTASCDLSSYTRDEILSEIVSFANTQGGTLVLGLDETKEQPPCASAITPLPRIGELARRFEDQARSCIEPPLPLLRIWPVETESGTGKGVIVFRTGPSQAAPHRLATGHAYKRHGSSTTRMDMREIQDMTLDKARGLASIDRSFIRSSSEFRNWCNGLRQTLPLTLIRVTAVPLQPLPDPGRLYLRTPQIFLPPSRYRVRIASHEKPVRIHEGDGYREQPILRGVRRLADGSWGRLKHELFQSGQIDYWSGIPARQIREPVESGDKGLRLNILWQGHVVAMVQNVLDLLDHFRISVGAPDAEFALEVQCGRWMPDGRVVPTESVYQTLLADNFGQGRHTIDEWWINLPRISIGPKSEFNQIINIIDADIFDALGVGVTRDSITIL